MQNSWHNLRADEVAKLLEVNPKTGLTMAEVERRQAKYGLNRISARRGTPAWVKFLHQFNAPLVYILLAAVVVTGVLGEWVDSAVIFTVVFINAIVGYLQESKAEKAIGSLSKMIPAEATVLRDNRKVRALSEALVPGDVVLLQAGDQVPADVRVIYARNFQVDESALTGESIPASKDFAPLPAETGLADRRNIAFSGTLVTAGQAEGIVCAIGNQTETGNIARLISESVDISTPLTKKISRLSALLVWVILTLAAATFIIGVFRGERPVEMFMAAVALAVGAIPEGLPAAVTIVLAIGVSRMAKRRAIIRMLPAVETLGSTTIICSDKTGTLTENQMTVRSIFAGGRRYDVSGSGYAPKGEISFETGVVEVVEATALSECLRAGVLCNDSQLSLEEGRWKVHGDPTEAALLVVGEKAGLLRPEIHRAAPRLDVIPFESDQMFRATLHHDRAERVIYKVGAVERLLDRCVDMLGNDGKLAPLDKEAVHQAVAEMAAQGLRVLAFTRRHTHGEHLKLEHAHVAHGLTFLGLQGMIDPPRAEAVEAVRRCQAAGIAVKMITGDHLITARSIALQIGLKGELVDGALSAVAGVELAKISDADLPELAERTAVFARVPPEQKLRLVRALQSRGHVVAMTGDGVNDAPALKQADIGVAMGITGTDVAKGAADMILTDDNFASIEAAVEEGRGVFDNLTKFIVWTLPTNFGEAAILLTAIIFGTVLPALPVQLLWVNLMTAVSLGLMLVFEEKEKDLMLRPPRNPKRPLLTYALIMRTGLVCLIMLLGAFWLFYWEMKMVGETTDAARTAVINVIVLVEIGYLFNCRSLNHSVRAIGPFTNRWVVIGSLTMLAAQLLFTYAPIMNRLFHTTPISAESWLRIVGVAAFSFAAVEFEKWIRFGRHPDDHVIPE